jgi:sodium/proline symporter
VEEEINIMTIFYVFLAVYTILMITISLISRKKNETVDGFYMAGRAIPPWMSAFSYATAYFSAVMFIGHAGRNGFNYGISSLWIVFGNAFIGTWLAWKVLGIRTRTMTHRLNATTMPQFLEKRYNSKLLKYISALIIFVFLIPYAASVYKGLGFLFQTLLGFDSEPIELIKFGNNVILAMTGERIILVFMMLLTAFYLFVGGFKAASLADLIQGIIMVGGVVIMVLIVLTNSNVEGISGAISNLKNIDPGLAKVIYPGKEVPLISLVIMTSLGAWGLPQMVHKFYTIKDEKSVKTARRASTLFALLIAFGAYFTGAVGRLIIGNEKAVEYAVKANGVDQLDKIMPIVMNTALPKVAAALILVLVLAASMSTLAAIVIAASNTFTNDLIKLVGKHNMKEKNALLISKLSCVLFVVIAFILAITPNSILNLNALSWGVVSGGMLAPYLLGLYWKKATKISVYAGILSSILIVTIGVVKFGGISSAYMATISATAIIAPIFVIIIVSLFTKKYDDEHINHVFGIEKIN